MTGLESVRMKFRRFAEKECRGYSDHYYMLANAVAQEDTLLAFIAGMPVTQPNLFLAAVQFLTGPEQMPNSGAELRAFVRAQQVEIARLMQSRRTQTNEVGRCAALLPALPVGPLALLEVGASAGLCLLLDAYCYDYGDVKLGNQKSPVRLKCAIEGSPPLTAEMPSIQWRAGLDLNPIDLHEERDVRWLLSCVWPDHPERRSRLAAAIELAQSHDLKVHPGDLLLDLPSLLEQAPQDATLVVFHSAVLNYVSQDGRKAFAETLLEASRSRDIVWISNEAPTVVSEITELADSPPPLRFLLGRTQLRHGSRHDELLAFAHPHGAELEWLS